MLETVKEIVLAGTATKVTFKLVEFTTLQLREATPERGVHARFTAVIPEGKSSKR